MVSDPPHCLHTVEYNSSVGNAEKSEIVIQKDHSILDIKVVKKSPRSQYKVSIDRQQCSQLWQFS